MELGHLAVGDPIPHRHDDHRRRVEDIADIVLPYIHVAVAGDDALAHLGGEPRGARPIQSPCKGTLAVELRRAVERRADQILAAGSEDPGGKHRTGLDAGLL